MYTIKLRINEKVYKNLMWFLKRFSDEEIQVIRENKEFLSVQQYLEKELIQVEDGTTEYISLDELNEELESAIRKHEDQYNPTNAI